MFSVRVPVSAKKPKTIKWVVFGSLPKKFIETVARQALASKYGRDHDHLFHRARVESFVRQFCLKILSFKDENYVNYDIDSHAFDSFMVSYEPCERHKKLLDVIISDYEKLQNPPKDISRNYDLFRQLQEEGAKRVQNFGEAVDFVTIILKLTFGTDFLLLASMVSTLREMEELDMQSDYDPIAIAFGNIKEGRPNGMMYVSPSVTVYFKEDVSGKVTYRTNQKDGVHSGTREDFADWLEDKLSSAAIPSEDLDPSFVRFLQTQC